MLRFFMQAITVKELNKYIKGLYSRDFILQNLAVKGEISNYKESHGNFYFSLKDETVEAIDCIMFGSVLDKLKTDFTSGQEVIIQGELSFYEKIGKTSIIVRYMEIDGVGKYYIELEKLKKKLQEKGMFDDMYKKPIPKYGYHIGVVTSKTGAAIEDIKRTIYNKNPHAHIVLYPCKVQGEGAAESVIEGVKTLDDMNLDCIIVARGGGSKEDLYCFNDENLAYAIFSSDTPIISAVGHEIDTSITDLVADLRVATPTAAGEACTFDYHELMQDLVDKRNDMIDILSSKIDKYKEKVDSYLTNIDLLSPRSKIERHKVVLKEKSERLKNITHSRYSDIVHIYNEYIEKLKASDSLSKMKKGFAYVTNDKNK
ncbi:MAG: exodeoxyribonuclease VII large subunit, partial [Lachnospiraceae bacterium]|nr:exodeoxyribonuclease VII large subunit [Lachnospiraceae bacterium]